jgi:hypothetical protein
MFSEREHSYFLRLFVNTILSDTEMCSKILNLKKPPSNPTGAKVKIKQFHYEACTGPEDSRRLRLPLDGVTVVSPTDRPPLPPPYSFLLESESTQRIITSLKIPLTPSGIESVTFWSSERVPRQNAPPSESPL